jgi:hypothetical protein
VQEIKKLCDEKDGVIDALNEEVLQLKNENKTLQVNTRIDTDWWTWQFGTAGA